jgi:general secretion pathway protein L
MSTSVYSLPLRPDASAQYAETLIPSAAAGARDKELWAWVPAAAMSWHKVTLPAGLHKQASRLKPALQALLEESLLDDAESMHLSLQPNWQAGSDVWVAACNKAWLQTHIQQLQSLGHEVHRILPEWAPPVLLDKAAATTASSTSPQAAWIGGTPEDAWLWVSDAAGLWRLPLEAGMAHWAERLNAAASQGTSPIEAGTPLVIQASPAVAELAQRSLLGLQSKLTASLADAVSAWRIETLPTPERMLRAADTQWDLAQFEFAAHDSARWRQSLLRAWQSFTREAAWRPVRWGLVSLLVVQCLGLNVVSWQLNDKLKTQRDLQKNLLTQTFPNVPVVDPSLQMARELDRLQRNAGTLKAGDLESVLHAVGASLPASQTVSALDFSGRGDAPGSETKLQGLALSSEQEISFVQAMAAKGYTAQLRGSDWRILANTARP